MNVVAIVINRDVEKQYVESDDGESKRSSNASLSAFVMRIAVCDAYILLSMGESIFIQKRGTSSAPNPRRRINKQAFI